MQLGSWQDNWKTCCSIGMQPLIFTEETKINDFITAASLAKIEKDTRFWTGGFRHEISRMWSWCTKDTPLPIDDDLLLDITDNSDKTDNNCVSISINISTSKYSMPNILCNTDETTDPSPPHLACELIAKKPNDKMIVNSTCMGARCGINRQCKKKDAIKKFADKGVDLSNMRYGFGEHFSACNRYFLFSNESTTFDDAREKCCALGMQLLSVKSATKRICLSKLARKYRDIADEFWTSGTDLDCKGNFRWCSVDRAFLKSEVLWAAGEPNGKEGRCVTIKMSTMFGSTTLQTTDCGAKKRYVCEARQSGTTVKSILNRCTTLIGLQKDQVDALQDTENYTYAMKCYLKCVGDGLEMIDNGYLQCGYTMRLFEKFDVETSLKTKDNAIDQCNTKMDPNGDACQSVYEMFVCVKEQLPQGFNKILFDNLGVEPAAKIPRTCYYQQNVMCTLNTTLKASYDINRITSDGGSSIIGIDGQNWFKSARGNYTNVDALKYCCSLGMQKPFATSLDEFNKLRDWMDGENYDNFLAETYTDTQYNEEKWCDTDTTVKPEISENNFKLDQEPSFFYLPKGSPKVRSLPHYKMGRVTVSYFYCSPR
ncbi:uncharacterized protein LOC135939591 [Cloeon dipterum]|uniref:uncharacterized protein LOC135939591 n=1 Tax=Cloeon dipterum TaxID=197152 RepID=UPI0032208E2D